MGKKAILLRVISIFVIFGGFILYISNDRAQEPSFKVNEDEFTVFEEKEAMFEEVYKGKASTALAASYGLVKKLDLEFPLIEARRTVSIEQAWYSQEGLFLLYSLELKKEDRNESDIPYLWFDELSFQKEGEKEVRLPVEKSNESIYQNWLTPGVVYKHRIYRGVLVRPDYARVAYDKSQTLWEWGKTDSLALVSPSLQNREKDQTFKLKDISLPIKANLAQKDALETFQINKEIQMDNGQNIRLDSLEMGINSNRLYFTPGENTPPVQTILADFWIPNMASEWDGMYSTDNSVSYDEEGKPYIRLQPFHSKPKKLDMTLQGIEFAGEEGMSFEVSHQMLQKAIELTTHSEVEVDEFVGNVNEMEIFFNGFKNENVSGNNMGETVNIRIKVKNPTGDRFPIWFRNYTSQMENLKHNVVSANDVPIPPEGPIIKISNTKGEIAESFGGMSERGPGEFTQSIIIEKEFLERSDGLKIELLNFPTYVEVKEQAITVPIAATEE
ncbi:hypothetical protein [Pseudalkalibacillus caeni]|uniref:DUF4179 domain-containing protein n=1 Tax=Exobacillus caeni TaxID=2574798 RepID=A0A5R9FBG6_9BACL|nr:hypothetical protein [Pseudalkalibacillus caeni]TLS38233.1 hypothetical protein FCL54_06775 [Pseudalkalibacillus caeni]